ncbi:hypothetical protein TNCT_311021 [Trichonephila clavata]|uniref:Uncharacterized protein n=1 Tax=Trichonephila clavata TaxID=2740835 RepID=A0A8X6J1P9_TRICU|nr:hypothetical protein TNCT_311021 [Trichonephila clavata]
MSSLLVPVTAEINRTCSVSSSNCLPVLYKIPTPFRVISCCGDGRFMAICKCHGNVWGVFVFCWLEEEEYHLISRRFEEASLWIWNSSRS